MVLHCIQAPSNVEFEAYLSKAESSATMSISNAITTSEKWQVAAAINDFLPDHNHGLQPELTGALTFAEAEIFLPPEFCEVNSSPFTCLDYIQYVQNGKMCF